MKIALILFHSLEKICLVVPMAFLCCCIVINILMRAFFNSGISWLEEFSRYIFVFSTFLGASIAVETDQHPKMTALLDFLPRTASIFLKLVGNLFCAVLSIDVTYYGYHQIAKMISNGAVASSLPVPMYVPYLIIPFGMMISSIRYLCIAWKCVIAIRSSDTELEKGGVS